MICEGVSYEVLEMQGLVDEFNKDTSMGKFPFLILIIYYIL